MLDKKSEELRNEKAAFEHEMNVLQEKEEMDRILYELSVFVSEFKDPILSNISIVYQLDFIFCKGIKKRKQTIRFLTTYYFLVGLTFTSRAVLFIYRCLRSLV